MVAHSLAAAKRLRKELQNLERHKDEDDDIFLIPDADNILNWAALIRGPKDTPYEGGVFQLKIVCGTDYPLAPPTMTFITKVGLPLENSATFSAVLLYLPLDSFVSRSFTPMCISVREIFVWIFSRRSGLRRGACRQLVEPFWHY